jgi:hypothetical protein
MPETFVLTVPILWSPGMGLAYTAWGVAILYAAWRWIVGLIS